jgi:hypothetical protein
MKKFVLWVIAIGLLGVMVLGAGAFMAYRAARQLFENTQEPARDERRFVAPASGELSQDQLDRFARVQTSIKDALGNSAGEIEAKYRELRANADGSRPPAMEEVMAVLSELSTVMTDARRARTDALNREHFSPAEYEWVRTRFYQAAGVSAASVRLEKMADAARRGTSIATIEAPSIAMDTVPQKNRDLVRPMLRYVDDWLPLAFLGL